MTTTTVAVKVTASYMAIGPMEAINLADGDLHVGEYGGDVTFDDLRAETAWAQRTILIHGREVKQPRLTALYGCDYRYSGKTLLGLPWGGAIQRLRLDVQALLGVDFNSALLNFYRDGSDSIGWHADNEKELGEQPIIASLSFGGPRTFSLRRRDGADAIDLTLTDNSLVVMSGYLQKHWLHSVPKESNVDPRINVTFRRINT